MKMINFLGKLGMTIYTIFMFVLSIKDINTLVATRPYLWTLKDVIVIMFMLVVPFIFGYMAAYSEKEE